MHVNKWSGLHILPPNSISHSIMQCTKIALYIHRHANRVRGTGVATVALSDMVGLSTHSLSPGEIVTLPGMTYKCEYGTTREIKLKANIVATAIQSQR